MITHVIVYNRLKQELELQGHVTPGLAGRFQSPLIARHPERGEIEVHFCGENFRVDESVFPFPMEKLTRQELAKVWKFESGIMDEVAVRTCVCTLVCTAISRLKSGRRIGVAFPDTHSFFKYVRPLADHLRENGIELFFICSDLSVAHIPALPQANQLPAGGGRLLTNKIL